MAWTQTLRLVGQHLVDDLLARRAAREALGVGCSASLHRRHGSAGMSPDQFASMSAMRWQACVTGQPLGNGERGQARTCRSPADP
jgi:hypothetical protein